MIIDWTGWRNISGFFFEWPWALLLLLLIPGFWWLYMRRIRQKLVRLSLQFSYAAVVEQIKAQPALWKRLLLPLSVSAIIALLVIGLARPTVTAKVGVQSADIMLVLDISLSMLAEDIKPDRMNAAKEAAIQFVQSLPSDARIGLEFFAGDNYVVSPPTSRHEEIIAYLRALKREDLKPRTEIGSALRTALQILNQQSESAVTTSTPKAENTQQSAPTPSKPDQVIILLSDGDSHEGFPWNEAAKQARAANVTIHTIGVGSAEGSSIVYQGVELPVLFDETTLRQTAELGGGSYFRVFKKADFRKVYEQIHQRTVHYEQRDIDLAFAMAGAGLLTLLIALGLAIAFL
ncbi:VWA domain-containing protein [Vampirovibrio sp.]|uniref:vWA domain-containing protein n=1 Tax=Vampirovibrio sp. TaxID=2717857 RepID=UPI003593EE27